MFLSDLAKRSLPQAIKNIGEPEYSINSLFWDDDLILISKKKEGLDNLLDILEKYREENHLLINTKKTK